MSDYKQIGVIGGGAWGTAIALKMAELSPLSLAKKLLGVRLWAFEPEVAQIIADSGENKPFLPDVKLPKSITATNAFADLKPCELIFLVAPVQHIRALSKQFQPFINPKVPIVICSKGIETSSGLLVSDVLAEIMPNPLAVMSGPSFAMEAAQNKPTALTLAAEPALAKDIIAACSQPLFRLYPCDDIIGAQLGGAIKNVIAIACGIAEGLALGQNARAALIARGVAESVKLVEKMGGDRQTLLGLSGLGDMVLTCTSLASRNTSLGIALGKGEKLQTILNKRSSANEGVWTAAALAALAEKYKIEMPICLAVNNILSEKTSVAQAIQDLLEREIPSIEIN